jgi:adenine-specific DNA methylase
MYYYLSLMSDNSLRDIKTPMHSAVHGRSVYDNPEEKTKALAAAVSATALVAIACALVAEARAVMATNAAAEAAAKPTTNSGAKHAAKSCAKSGTNSSTNTGTNSDAKTRRIRRHLAVRKLAGKILSLLLPRRHFGCLKLRNTQLLKLILNIGHVINLQ